MKSEAASRGLADPGLGDDSEQARVFLFEYADVSHDFYAAVQNAAKGGHKNVLKLVLAADPDFQETKQDALRSAGRAGLSETLELLTQAAGPETNTTRRTLHSQFLEALHANNKPAADQALDGIVALMFPRSPKID